MTNLTVLAPPLELAVPLNTAKSFLRIGYDGDDALITDLIEAATARVEQFAGLALVRQVLRVEWLQWPSAITGRGVQLPRVPVTSVQAVTLVSEDDATSARAERDGMGTLSLAKRRTDRQ